MLNLQAILQSIRPYVTGWIRNQFVFLQSPLTSTSWDGDTFSTTSKTLLNLASTFGTPAGIKAVYTQVFVRDSASSTSSNYFIILSPTNVANEGIYFSCNGLVNNAYARHTAIVPCNEDGNIYYQTLASGTNTMNVWMQVWGYWL